MLAHLTANRWMDEIIVTSSDTHHFVTAVWEKSPKSRPVRIIINPLSEPRSPVLLYLVWFEMRRHCWSSQKSVRAHLLRSEPRPALIGCRGDTGKHRQVNHCGAAERRCCRKIDFGINHIFGQLSYFVMYPIYAKINGLFFLFFFLPKCKLKLWYKEPTYWFAQSKYDFLHYSSIGEVDVFFNHLPS